MLQLLFLVSFFGPKYVTGKFTCLDPDWSIFEASCYKIEGQSNYANANHTCHNLGGYVIMPKTDAEKNFVNRFRTELCEGRTLTNMFNSTTYLCTYLKTGACNAGSFVAIVYSKWDMVWINRVSKQWYLDLGERYCCIRPRSKAYMTICQRDADQERTSNIDITSSLEITTTNHKTSEGPTTTEADLIGTTSSHLSINSETIVGSSTLYSSAYGSHASKGFTSPSSVISTNSTHHCIYMYVSICSKQSNDTRRSQGYTCKVVTKKLSSYKRKHQSALDTRKSSMYIGSVGIAVLLSVVLLIMFLDCVPTKV